MISITLESVSRVDIEDEWNFSNDTEFTMHSIHTYPAKFPAFIAKKAFDYAKAEGVNIKKVADIFCGCGTVALEAKMHGKDFWGCDINPVATLIAKVKSESYDIAKIEEYFLLVSTRYPHVEVSDDAYEEANERLKYWFTQNSYIQILRLKIAIENSVPEGAYLDAFHCLFSAILKTSSKWLTKSIKPQVDPNKKEELIKVNSLFRAYKNDAFFTNGNIIGKKSEIIIACVAGKKALKFRLDIHQVKKYNQMKDKLIGRILPPYITQIQQSCANHIVREGIMPTPEAIFGSINL